MRGRTRQALIVGVEAFAPTASGGDGPIDDWPALPFAASRVTAVERALRQLGYDCTSLTGAAGPTGAELADAIWTAVRRTGRDGTLVVHILSHGYVGETTSLYVVGADGDPRPRTEVTGWLRRLVDFPDHPQILFLLDVCNSGIAARPDWQPSRAADDDNRVWVIASCAPRENAYNGRFSQAVANVLDSLTTAGIDLDRNVEFAPLGTVAREIRREVRRLALDAGAPPQTVVGTLIDLGVDVSTLPFFPNHGYRPQSRRKARPTVADAVAPFLDDLDEALDATHFIGRAGGHGPVLGDAGIGCFSGRGRELRSLSAWVDGQDPRHLRVVTGSPGVGKSALLGVLVCAAHPLLREPTQGLWRHVDRAPFINHRLVGVHARQRSLDQIVASITEQAIPAGDAAPDGTAGDRAVGYGAAVDGDDPVAALIAALAALPQPPVVILDALDEAIDALAVMRHLLLPMTRARRPDGVPVCRLLVAMRPWDEFTPLREAAAADDGVIDLDGVPDDQLRYDLDRYVDFLLRQCPPYDDSDYTAARATFADVVARRLTAFRATADDRWGEFLVAGLFTNHLVRAHPPIAELDRIRKIADEVPRRLPDLLELDLRSQSDNRLLRPVLAVLAHAKGNGMPARVLRTVVGAFATDAPTDHPAGTLSTSTLPPAIEYPGVEITDTEITVAEITKALGVARFYLRHATDTDGTTLYRLFHQGLADYLRTSPTAESRAGGAESRAGGYEPDVLLDLILADAVGKWDLAEPYLRRHAIGHAVDVGREADLFDTAEFLVQAEPDEVLVVAAGHPNRNAGIYHRALSGQPDTTVDQRRTLIAREATDVGALDLAYAVAYPPDAPPPRWRPVWHVPCADHQPTRRPSSDPPPWTDVILTSGTCTAVSCGPDAAGDLAAVALVDGRIVEINQLTAAQPEFVPLADIRGWAAEHLEFDVRRHAVLAGLPDGSALVWDWKNGMQRRFSSAGDVTAVTAVRLSGGPPLTVSVAAGTSVRTYPFDNSTEPSRTFLDPPVTAAAFAEFGSTDLLVTGHADGTLRATRLAHRVTGPVLVAADVGAVSALAATADHDRVFIVAACDETLVVRTWWPDQSNPTTVNATLPLPEPTVAVACSVVDGGLLILVAGGALYRLRLSAAGLAHGPAGTPAPAAPVFMNLGEVEGQRLAMTVGETTVRDLRQVVLTATPGGDITIRDLRTGRARHVLWGHVGPILACATGRLPTGSVVVSIGVDGTVRLWDARNGATLGVSEGAEATTGAVSIADFGGYQVVITDTGQRWRLPTLEPLPYAPQPALPDPRPEGYDDFVAAVPLPIEPSRVLSVPDGSMLAVVNGSVALFRHSDNDSEPPRSDSPA